MSRYTEACSVHFDSVSSEKMNMFAKTLSGVAVREIKGDNSIAQSLDFFEMYGVQKLDDFNIIEQWQKNRTFNTMKALWAKRQAELIVILIFTKSITDNIKISSTKAFGKPWHFKKFK